MRFVELRMDQALGSFGGNEVVNGCAGTRHLLSPVAMEEWIGSRRSEIQSVGPIRQNYRFIDLAVRNSPVGSQKTILFLVAHDVETIFLIESNCPGGSFPRADQFWPGGQFIHELKERPAYPLVLKCGSYIGVPDQG